MAVQTLGSLSIENREFYEKALLKRLKETYKLYKYAQKTTLPKNSGDVISWRVFKKLALPTSALTEGVTPVPNHLDIVKFKATLSEYGDYIEISDLLDLEGIDPIMTETSELFGEQVAEYVDNLIRNVLLTGINVYYSKGTDSTQPTARSQIDATNTISLADINKVKAILKRYNVEPYENGKYIFMIDPEVEYDLKTLSTANASWIDVTKYTQGDSILDGEVGTFLGFKWVVNNNISVVAEGASSANVHLCLAFGKNAFGVVELEGSSANPALIHEPPHDPLHQKSTLGWKIPGFTTRILHDEAILRFECASGLTPATDLTDSSRIGYDSVSAGTAGLTKTLDTPVLTAGVNKVTWAVITGADYYEVHTSATESGTYAFASVTRGTEQAVEGTEYYKVKAVATNGDVSALSTAATKSA
jgi:N4-gp56 family major capsid protein